MCVSSGQTLSPTDDVTVALNRQHYLRLVLFFKNKGGGELLMNATMSVHSPNPSWGAV